MCWRCAPDGRDEDARAIDAAIEAAAQGWLRPRRIARRAVLRAVLTLLLSPAAQLFQGCATVPVTGRSQLRLISAQDEAALGVKAFQQLQQRELKRGRLLTAREAPADYAWVTRVADRILWASGLGNVYRWEFMLINAPRTVNAAAIAGGRIVVYTGILPVARDDAGLAAILGHEVAHVMAHHTAERISQYELVNLAGAVAGAAGLGDLTLAVLGLGAEVGILLPFSRSQESEADHIGLLLMAKAGYDPREAIALWRRMEQAGGASGRGPEFLSTHPNPGTRIADLEAWLPQAWQYYQNNSLPLPNME